MVDTYYERLGVAPDASTDAVEAAYRARLKEVHPDVSDDPAAAERTRRLIEAKRVLTDDHERSVYDRIGHGSYTAEEGPETESTESADASEPPDAGTRAADGGAETDRERRRRRNRRTRAAWNPRASGAGGVATQGGGAWESDGAYRVYPADASSLGRRLFPIGPSVVMLFVAFWLYPVLLWGAVEPAFQLAFNLVLGGCLVALIGYFLTMPPVAVAIFGGWTLLVPAGLAAAGVADGAVWFVGVVGTLVPLLLATVVWAVLRA